MKIELTKDEITNTLVCIRGMWKNGEVREEAIGAELSALRKKYEDALKPTQEAPKRS